MKNAKLQFDCPFCTKEITIDVANLAPNVYIKCNNCKQLTPAGVFYDTSTISK